MNYRHIYHAGNFADVFKHILLIAITQSFLHKDTPFCYIETHAGKGQYDLLSDEAQKSKEFENGINKIWHHSHPPAVIRDYLQSIQYLNENQKNHFYPGSPFFVKTFLRHHDRMILSELHPAEYVSLKYFFSKDARISIHHQDGYQSLKAFLPPKERRGLVLIDPPYENQHEFEDLLKIIPETLKRWETGVYALWYPIKNRLTTDRWLKACKEKIKRPLLIAELSIYPDDIFLQLNGCGMLIINPPWQLEHTLQKILPWLWKVLSINQQGRYHLDSMNTHHCF